MGWGGVWRAKSQDSKQDKEIRPNERRWLSPAGERPPVPSGAPATTASRPAASEPLTALGLAWVHTRGPVRRPGPPGGTSTDRRLAGSAPCCMHLPPLHPMQESSKTFTEMQSSAHGLLNSAFWLPARFACQSKCCGALLHAAGRETGLKTAKHGVRPKHNEKQ